MKVAEIDLQFGNARRPRELAPDLQRRLQMRDARSQRRAVFILQDHQPQPTFAEGLILKLTVTRTGRHGASD